MKPVTAHTLDAGALSTALDNIDGLVQASCKQIETLASMATLALETPVGCRNTEMLASVLTMVRQLALQLSSDVNSTAVETGCDITSGTGIDGDSSARRGALQGSGT